MDNVKVKGIRECADLDRKVFLQNGAVVVQKEGGQAIGVYLVIPFRDHKNRYPNGSTIAYCTLVDRHKLRPKAGDDAQDARWFRLSWKRQDGLLQICLADTTEASSQWGGLTALLRPMVLESPLGQDTYYELLENQGLAFDHAKIIATAIPRLERLPSHGM